MEVKIGKSRVWIVGKSQAVHVPKWWFQEYAQSGEVTLYIDEHGRLILEPVGEEQGGHGGGTQNPPVARRHQPDVQG